MLKIIVVSLSIFAGTWLVWVFLAHKNDQLVYNLPPHPFVHLPFQRIAHRGGSLEAPENTFAAFDHALKVDPEAMFELDVRLTKDSEVILMHDPTVDRTTDGSGRVEEMTLAEIQKLDAAFRFKAELGDNPYSKSGVRVPLLKEVLARYPTTKMIVEMKDNYIGRAEPVAEVVKQANAGDRVIFASEFQKMLVEVHRYIQPNPFGGLPMTGKVTPEQMEKAAAAKKDPPPWMFASSKDEVERTVFLDSLKLIGIDRMKAEFLSIPESYDGRPLLTDTLIAEAHRRFKKIFVWTINDENDMKRLLQRGVDGIITDRPSLLKKVVDSIMVNQTAAEKLDTK